MDERYYKTFKKVVGDSIWYPGHSDSVQTWTIWVVKDVLDPTFERTLDRPFTEFTPERFNGATPDFSKTWPKRVRMLEQATLFSEFLAAEMVNKLARDLLNPQG